MKIGHVIAVVLEPAHGCTAFAIKSCDILFVGFLEHLCDGEVLAHINLFFVHHNVMD